MLDFIIKYWVEFVMGGVISLLTYLNKMIYSKYKTETEEQKLIKDALLAILHDRLYQASMHYIEQDSISIKDLDNLDYLYRGYHALDGNGVCSELYDRCRNLPIIK